MISQQPILLDTDTLSAIMRQHPVVMAHVQAYLKVYKRFVFSIITRYEILRGLNAKKAWSQLAVFEQFCANSQILALTDDIVVKAASIYADLHQRGILIGDDDILIGATGLVYDLTIVTNNEKHFNRIKGLRLENWLKD